MNKKIPILLLTKDRATLLERVLARLIKYTDWDYFDLWILDNLSTPSNKKIIAMFKYRYPFINIYATSYNQLALIQNEVIAKLRADFYIKLDDDILVTENWTAGMIGVYERHNQTMSFGSVIVPINGFGWVPFIEIMRLANDFKTRFPNTSLNQDCMDVAVYKDPEVNQFIWENCLNLDNTAKTFVNNQNGQFKDMLCPHRYSIGAIIFSHDRWEQMGGWFVQDRYSSNLRKQKLYNKIASYIQKIKKYKDDERWGQIANILSLTNQGRLGLEEEEVFKFSIDHDLTIPVTTQSLLFHFSFGPVDQFLMNTIFSKITF